MQIRRLRTNRTYRKFTALPRIAHRLVLACFALFLGVASVFAFAPTPVASADTTPTPSTSIVLNQSSANGIPYITGNDSRAWPSILSQAAVVMDMNTGTIIYAKNPNVQHFPASITKIMTALLALKYGHLTDVLTASKKAVNQPPDKLYMIPGEKHNLQSLLYGMLLDSANDVAVEIAQHYGGSVSKFAAMMNQEAVSLGALHTHFVNPNGLPNPQHVTTAYDMALIARAAMQYPEFRKIVSTKYYAWKGQAWHSNLSNLNGMLFTYPGTIGIKTGWTSVAHETLVVAAKRGQNTFLAVLMDTPTAGEIQQDATSLLNYAFAHYQTQNIVQQGEVVGTLPGGHVQVTATHNVLATVPKGNQMSVTTKLSYALPPAGVHMGQKVGILDLRNAAGDTLTTMPIAAASNWKNSKVNDGLLRVNVLVPLIVVLSILLKLVRMWVGRKLRAPRYGEANYGAQSLRFRSTGIQRFRNWRD